VPNDLTTVAAQTALILFSHGSLLCGAGRTLEIHAGRIRATGVFASVEIGYLNYSQPSFEAAVERAVASGARQIVAAPYFLVEGRFVTADLPAKIAAVRDKHPNISIVLARAIADYVAIAGAITDLIPAAVPLDEAIAAWCTVPAEECRHDVQCPVYHTSACPAEQVS